MSAFEDAIDVADVVESMRALLPGGLEGLPNGLARALARDDYSDALAVARERWSKVGTKELGAALAYALLLGHRGLFDEARGVLGKALAAHEGEVSLQLAQAERLALEGRGGDALALLEGMRAVEIRDPRAWCFMGDLYLELGEIDDVIACYREALERSSQDIERAYRLARLLLERGEIFDGARYLEWAARLAVTEPRLWELAGDAWREAGEEEKAAGAYGRWTKLEEDEEGAWYARGSALAAAGELEAAREALRKAVRLDPFMVDAWVELGQVELERGFLDEAKRGYREALELEPGRVEALYGLMAAAYELGEMEYALEVAEDVTVRAPERADGHFNRGVLLAEVGRHEEAKEALERAVALEGEDAMAWASLAVTRLRLGDEQGARDASASAEQVAPGDSGVAMCWAQGLLTAGRYEEVREYIAGSGERGGEWEMVSAVYEYVACALSGGGVDEALGRFERALTEHGGELPVVRDLEEVERLARVLGREERRRVESMVRRLEEEP